MSALPDDIQSLIKLGEETHARLEKMRCENSFEFFVKTFWEIIEPGQPLIWSWHIDTVCGYLQAFNRGELPDKRLIINIPPGTLKSILCSVMLPCFIWVAKPEERILTFSAEQSLAVRDLLRMKQIILSDKFQQYWPLLLAIDQNEKMLFVNARRGSRAAIGINSAITGRRGSLLILDDCLDTKQAYSDVIRESVNTSYDQVITSRLNDPVKSGICIIQQRAHYDDLTGHLLRKTATKWTHLVIPMRYEGTPTFDAGRDIGRPELNDPRTKKGELLFPSRFTEQAVKALAEDVGEYGFATQYQQRPSVIGGGILKRHWWRTWEIDKPLPTCDHIFHSYDTAFSEADSKTSAFSACTRWGIFWHEERDRYCILALGMWFARVGYDELRRNVQEMNTKYKPDAILIEKKATGISLIQDMKRAVPGKIRAYSPGKGEDKISRAHSVSPMLESGQVFVPAREWALGNGKDKLGLVDYAAMFPTGAPPCSDITDTLTQALIYLRAGHWSGDHPDDKEVPYDAPKKSDEELEDEQPKRKAYYA